MNKPLSNMIFRITRFHMLLLWCVSCYSAHATNPPSEIGKTLEASPHMLAGQAFAALKRFAPPAGQFGKLPYSEIGVLVQPGEFPFCDYVYCDRSWTAFTAWTGMSLDTGRGHWYHIAGGGHNNSGVTAVYRYDFTKAGQLSAWTRPVDPSPYDGPNTVDKDGDGIKERCPQPSSGPVARHTYDGQLYVPSVDKHIHGASGAFCPDGLSWVAGSWTMDPLTHKFEKIDNLSLSYPRSAWDPLRDKIYTISKSKNGLYETDPQKDFQTKLVTRFSSPSEGVAEFDKKNRFFYWSNNRKGLYRIYVSPEGKFATQEFLTDSGSFPYSFALHIPTGKLVGWDGAGKVAIYDPVTRRTRNISPGAGLIPPDSAGRPYSKWRYIEGADLFVGIDDARNGIFLYKLPATESSTTPD